LDGRQRLCCVCRRAVDDPTCVPHRAGHAIAHADLDRLVALHHILPSDFGTRVDLSRINDEVRSSSIRICCRHFVEGHTHRFRNPHLRLAAIIELAVPGHVPLSVVPAAQVPRRRPAVVGKRATVIPVAALQLSLPPQEAPPPAHAGGSRARTSASAGATACLHAERAEPRRDVGIVPGDLPALLRTIKRVVSPLSDFRGSGEATLQQALGRFGELIEHGDERALFPSLAVPRKRKRRHIEAGDELACERARFENLRRSAISLARASLGIMERMHHELYALYTFDKLADVGNIESFRLFVGMPSPRILVASFLHPTIAYVRGHRFPHGGVRIRSPIDMKDRVIWLFIAMWRDFSFQEIYVLCKPPMSLEAFRQLLIRTARIVALAMRSDIHLPTVDEWRADCLGQPLLEEMKLAAPPEQRRRVETTAGIHMAPLLVMFFDGSSLVGREPLSKILGRAVHVLAALLHLRAPIRPDRLPQQPGPGHRDRRMWKKGMHSLSGRSASTRRFARPTPRSSRPLRRRRRQTGSATTPAARFPAGWSSAPSRRSSAGGSSPPAASTSPPAPATTWSGS
jgi:hypothetical protein